MTMGAGKDEGRARAWTDQICFSHGGSRAFIVPITGGFVVK